MKHLLIIDDDPLTHMMVKGALKNEMEMVNCYKLAEAILYLEKGFIPELAIIDRMLPDGDGLSICTRMRADERLNSVPIIFLSSMSSESDKVSGLFAGADDYMTKPFSPLELRARIQARLRLTQHNFSVGNLFIDLNSQRAFVSKGQEKIEIALTRTEFKMLLTFAHALDQLFSRDTLLDKVWGTNANLSDRVIDTHVSHLRKKLKNTGIKIEALRGEGYRATISAKSKSAA